MKKERIELNFLGAGFGGAGFGSCICPGIDSCLNSRLNARLATGEAETRTAITAVTSITAIKDAMTISLFQALER